MPGPEIAKSVLFERLAAGHAAGITVVTPNRRLAQSLAREFDEGQAGKGLKVWETADILPLDAFVGRLYEDALYADGADGLPRLLAPAQERALWEAVLAGQPLLSVAQAAADCADAWRRAHAWRIAAALEKFPGNEDTQAFAGWAREYAKRCRKEGFVDAAVLPDVVLKSEGKSAKLLIAYGFDILPPQTREFLESFDVVSCHSELKKAAAGKIAFPSARHELEASAQWARSRLEGGAARIGVVVPDLQQRRKEVLRIFSNALRPGWNLPGAGRTAMPFDISIGEPLDGFPVVALAVGMLEFSGGEIPFENASQIIRSPFIGGAQAEMAARALLDADLRETLPPRLTLPRLIGAVEACPVLRALLEHVFSVQRNIDAKENPPHFWAQHFTALLQAAGYPGERAPDSDEFQARAKFNEVLADFSRLGVVSGPLTFQEAMRHLRRICAQTLFQPETPDAPIEVLGILESTGLEFDCLWVSGLTEEAWPLAARANPFLPVALQKKAGIPEAAAETSLALDRRITEGWLGAAQEVVFSYPEKEKDRDLLPSPLIAQVPAGEVDFEKIVCWRLSIFQSRKIESVPDGIAPRFDAATVKGGTRVLADQAACPFRAFARHRLAAEGLESPAEGLDALDRGNLLHSLMAGIWKEVKSREGLERDLSSIISRAAENAVKELEIEGRFAELEQKRLEKLALEWLDVERKRAAFEVIAIEHKRPIAIGGLEFSGRIDRMDRLADDSHVLIDYKTGSRATSKDWLGERPNEPQLPLYAVSAPEAVSAVAFARLRPGAMKFSGFSLDKNDMPGVRPATSWSGLIATWKTELETVASGFAQGDARVDPKSGFQTCRNCGLQPLCRVHERFSALAQSEEEERE